MRLTATDICRLPSQLYRSSFHIVVNETVDNITDDDGMICGDGNEYENDAHMFARAEEEIQTSPRRSSVGAIGNLACLCRDDPGHAGVQRRAGKRREL
jgi:hypothetical protein